MAEHGELELDERGDQEEEVERSASSPGDQEQKKVCLPYIPEDRQPINWLNVLYFL